MSMNMKISNSQLFFSLYTAYNWVHSALNEVASSDQCLANNNYFFDWNPSEPKSIDRYTNNKAKNPNNFFSDLDRIQSREWDYLIKPHRYHINNRSPHTNQLKLNANSVPSAIKSFNSAPIVYCLVNWATR